MKTATKILLVLALFCGTAFADGDMGNGGLWTPDGSATTSATDGGDMGNGGKTCPEGQTCITDESTGSFSVLDLINDLIAAAL